MTQKKRTLALLLAVAVAVALLSSSAFIIFHAEHDCAGEGCGICAWLSACAERLHQTAAAILAVALAAAAGAIYSGRAADPAVSRVSYTLVALKVKLSD